MNMTIPKNTARNIVVGTLTLALMASSATMAAGINDDKEVFQRLLYTAVADEIRKKCSSISARKITATLYVLNILSYAKSQGYPKPEIDAYRNDPVQQAKLRKFGYAYLDDHGVDRAAGTGYCELGQAEMASKSQIGKLLK